MVSDGRRQAKCAEWKGRQYSYLLEKLSGLNHGRDWAQRRTGEARRRSSWHDLVLEGLV